MTAAGFTPADPTGQNSFRSPTGGDSGSAGVGAGTRNGRVHAAAARSATW